MATSKTTKTVAKKAKRIVKAKPARKSAASVAFKHWADTSSAYADVRGDTRAVLICAAMVVSGFAKMNKANIGTAPKGNPALFVQLVGRTPLNHHRGSKRIDGDTLTKGGLEWFQRRISSEERFNLTADLIEAMRKGGKAGGLNFSHKVTA